MKTDASWHTLENAAAHFDKVQVRCPYPIPPRGGVFSGALDSWRLLARFHLRKAKSPRFSLGQNDRTVRPNSDITAKRHPMPAGLTRGGVIRQMIAKIKAVTVPVAIEPDFP